MSATSHRTRRCWACGRAHRAPDDPPEHIVGAGLGSVLTTDGFARSCNRELGRRVDQPFLRDFLVAVRRARYDIRDPRRPWRPPPNPVHHAETDSGRRVVFDWRGGDLQLPPHVVEDEERILITAESEEEARKIAATKLSRLRARGGEGKVMPVLRGQVAGAPVEARMGLSLDASIRARVAAKIALGAFSLVLPEDWLDTETAKLLQSWLWDDKPKTRSGKPIFAVPRKVPPPIDSFTAPPGHALFFMPGSGPGAVLGIVLFGEELMTVGTGPLDCHVPGVAWCLDPIARTCEETTFLDLAMRAQDAYPVKFEEFVRSSS